MIQPAKHQGTTLGSGFEIHGEIQLHSTHSEQLSVG